MNRFADPQLEEIHDFRYTTGLGASLCAHAHRVVRLLAAARAWSTLGIFTDPQPLKAGRFAVPVPQHRRWFVTFEWSADFGAVEMQLERI